MEVTGVLFIPSEKRTRGGPLSYNKTKLFKDEQTHFLFGLLWGLANLLPQKLSWSSLDRPPHVFSDKWNGADRKAPWPFSPQQHGRARFPDSPSGNPRRGWGPWKRGVACGAI